MLSDSGATKTGHSLHVVDDITPDDCSAGQLAALAKARPWRWMPGKTKIFVDPTADRDELRSIRIAFPGCTVIRKSKGQLAHSVEYGLRCVNTALRDIDGNTRLTFSSALPRGPRSLLTSIPKLRRKPSGEPHKDNTTDHVGLDCLRYPVAHLLPLQAGGITTIRR